MTREEVLRAVDLARKSCCGYIGKTCDCKYGADGKGEQTGCPELRELGVVLSRITDEHWLALESVALDEADPTPAEPRIAKGLAEAHAYGRYEAEAQLAAALAKVAELEQQLQWSREHEEDLAQENDNLRAAARRAAAEHLKSKESKDE